MSKQPHNNKQDDHQQDAPSAGGQSEGNRTDEYIRVTEHAHRQIEWVWKNWAYLGGFITVLFVVIGLLTWNNLSEYKKTMTTDLDAFKERLSVGVKEKIDKQFDDSNIRALIAISAQTRVDAIAEPLIRSNTETIAKIHIAPLKSEVSNLTENYTKLNTMLNTTMAKASQDYQDVSKQVEGLRLFFNAKIGDTTSFQKLTELSTNEPAISNLVGALLSDLDKQYADFIGDIKSSPSRNKRFLVHIKTLQPFRPDEITLYEDMTSHPNPYQRQATVNHVGDQNYVHFVEDLVNVIDKDNNLFVRSCAVVTVERLTGKMFSEHPPFDDVEKWWQTDGHTNSLYKSPFPTLTKARCFLTEQKYDEALKLFQQVTTNRTGFARSHFWMAMIYLQKKDREKAKVEFEKAQTEADSQDDTIFYYAGYLAENNEKQKAIEVLEKEKPLLADFAERAKKDERLKLLWDEPNFKKLIGEWGPRVR